MARTLRERRHALYDRLPTEVAEVVRCARRYQDHIEAHEHDNAEAELMVLWTLADELRKWEDRQLRIAAAVEVQSEPPKRRRRRRIAVPEPGAHLRLVPPPT